MEIKRGWATEYGKTRFDVLIEEVDLLRLLAGREVADPAAAASRMPVAHVYQVMDAEAQMFVSHSLARQEPARKAEHDAAYDYHRTARDRILDIYAPEKKPAG